MIRLATYDVTPCLGDGARHSQPLVDVPTEQVRARVAVDLQVNQAGDRHAAAPRRQADGLDNAVRNAHVPGQQRPVDERR